MIKNSLGRELPEKIGDYVVRPYQGAYATPAPQETVVTRRVMGHRIPSDTKLLPDLKTAIQASGLRDGMTISFHHSFREGDMIIGQVLTAIRELGIKHLRFAPSAVVNIKNPSIVDFVRDGTIDRIEASGIRGQLGDAVLPARWKSRSFYARTARVHAPLRRASCRLMLRLLAHPRPTIMATAPVRSGRTPAALSVMLSWTRTTRAALWS